MTSMATAEVTTGSSTAPRQFVVFYLGEREYAVDILAVREIRGWTEVTAIPNAPPAVLGVVNLRGTIVPILDLRVCFAQEATTPNRSHVVIILQIGEQLMGLLVDGVSDILTVRASDIQPTPSLQGAGLAVVPELVTIDKRIVGVLALERFAATLTVLELPS